MKKFFYVFVFGFISGLISFSEIQRIEFNKWPQMKFRNIRVLIADSDKLSNQGFAGATLGEMKNTIIIFPNISKEVIFTNLDQGYGSVKEDIKIYYLDKNFKILKYDIMKAEKGISIPPENSFIAVEGLP
ncbi:MAG: hypothetical protein NC816_03805 [Candidatus Omnitrophica bacterium]|nr:hypothetical protein [Candidatus Omnitrophota bacterium]MCM8808685.1 hypothetical protein [Candidatus Omnitrophota bacterium]MCM8811041.1 hypothetical protein [Candidatus Omnitrophota bacterium]MCM8833028.1 hypothetical protein [Candidatus Omnitrophota bacterium]